MEIRSISSSVWKQCGLGSPEPPRLCRVPDFRDIGRDEFDRLVSWMLDDGGLRLASGRLVLGPKAERKFSRKNFMELYAVFSSPQTYTVQTFAGQPLGSLSQGFVDRLVDGVSTFLLGGRGWLAVRVSHEDRRVTVEPAPRGKQPTWGGYLPQFLGHEVCQAVKRVLLGDEAYGYLDAAAAEALSERRARLRDVLDENSDGIEEADDEIRWWTFAGGRINATLRYALEATGTDWKVIPDNFLIKVRGEGIDARRFSEALTAVRDPTLWENDKPWTEVAEDLPSYRLSKFQPLMPPWASREVVASYLLDIPATSQWLASSGSSG